jgi:hypothetical protein
MTKNRDDARTTDADLLEQPETALEDLSIGTGGQARQGEGEGDGVLDGLGAALALVRQHGVGGVADQDEALGVPGGEGWAVEEGPLFEVFGLSVRCL